MRDSFSKVSRLRCSKRWCSTSGLEARGETLTGCFALDPLSAEPVVTHYRTSGSSVEPFPPPPDDPDQKSGSDQADARSLCHRRDDSRAAEGAGPARYHDLRLGPNRPRSHLLVRRAQRALRLQARLRASLSRLHLPLGQRRGRPRHRLPQRILRDGDIISVDVTVEYNGYIGDNA